MLSKFVSLCFIVLNFLFYSPVNFVKQNYYYMVSKKIFLNGAMEQLIILDPQEKYSIVCAENSKLLLKIAGSIHIASIKLSQNAKITLIKDTKKHAKLKIDSVRLFGGSAFIIHPDIVPIISDEKIFDKACIVKVFESWDHLNRSDLSWLGVSPELRALLKN